MYIFTIPCCLFVLPCGKSIQVAEKLRTLHSEIPFLFLEFLLFISILYQCLPDFFSRYEIERQLIQNRFYRFLYYMNTFLKLGLVCIHKVADPYNWSHYFFSNVIVLFFETCVSILTVHTERANFSKDENKNLTFDQSVSNLLELFALPITWSSSGRRFNLNRGSVRRFSWSVSSNLGTIRGLKSTSSSKKSGR